jgi:hypothetical protein
MCWEEEMNGAERRNTDHGAAPSAFHQYAARETQTSPKDFERQKSCACPAEKESLFYMTAQHEDVVSLIFTGYLRTIKGQ